MMSPEPSRRGGRRRWAVPLLATGLALAITCSAWAAFSAGTSNSNNQLAAAPDWVAPTVSGSVIQKLEGGVPGYIRQGGSYRILASVADTGNPSSGVSTVSSALSGAPAALTDGTFTAGGQSYNYRGSTVTAASTFAAGTYPYSVAATDGAGNARTQAGFSVVVDNTPATPTAVATQNKAGGTAGRPEIGDSATLTYGETIDPNSVIAGWNGAATNVVVRINNNVSAYSSRDALTIYNATNTTALPLGTVNLNRNDFVSANATFGATGTPSTFTLVGGVATVVLGTSAGTTTTSTTTTSMIWWPATGATDRAGNPTGLSSFTEAGAADKEF